MSDAGCVIAEDWGAGEIDSIWFTRGENENNGGNVTGTGRLTIELDGKTVVSGSLQDVVNGVLGEPFVFPLVANAEQTSGAVYIKVPMPYRDSMRVTVENNPLYYHVIYRRFSDNEGVTTFDPADRAQDVLAMLRAAGTRDPKPPVSGETTQRGMVTLVPGQHTVLGTVSGPGSIRALRVRLPDDAATDDTLKNVRVQIAFDGTTTVDSPIGEFFGSGAGEYSVRSLLFAMDDAPGGWYSSWWPMPYRQTVTVSLANFTAREIAGVESEITSAPDSQWADALGPRGDAGYFVTVSHAGATVPGLDWEIADVFGRGKFVGVSHVLEGPKIGHQLEGDERIHVDLRNTPQFHGTGTEDFYEGGWYFNRGVFSNWSNGLTAKEAGTGGCAERCDAIYRLMLTDAIPYRSAFRFGIEHGGQNEIDAVYGSTAFLYAQRGTYAIARTDAIEVGNPESRAVHDYNESEPASQYEVISAYEGDFDDVQVRRQVRATSGALSFRVAIEPANAGVHLRRTSDQQHAYTSADVLVDGAPVGTWLEPLGNPKSRWLDDMFMLPASATRGKSNVTITLRPAQNSPVLTAARYSVASVVAPFADTVAPAPVVGLTLTAGSDVLRLSWNDAADDVGVSEYRVYASTTSNVPLDSGHLVGISRLPAFSHAPPPSGEARYYRVMAVDGAGNVGAPSEATGP